MMYALVSDAGALVRTENFTVPPCTLSPAKGLRWAEFVEFACEAAASEASDGYSEGMEGEKWVRRYRVRDLTYAERRVRLAPCYAPLAEQLDMQYKDTQDGGSRWVSHIADVKAAHPKPVA